MNPNDRNLFFYGWAFCVEIIVAHIYQYLTFKLKAALAVNFALFFSFPEVTFIKEININVFWGIFFVWNAKLLFNIHDKY